MDKDIGHNTDNNHIGSCEIASFRLRKSSFAALTILAAISLVSSPLFFPAFAAKSIDNSAVRWSVHFTPSGVDSNIAKLHKTRLATQAREAISVNERFPFTPAGLNKIGERTLTVAARANDETVAKAISTRDAIAPNNVGTKPLALLQKTKYNLKKDKGWKGFEISALSKLPVPIGNSNRISRPTINFKLEDTKKAKQSKFQTSMQIAKPQDATPSPIGNAAGENYVVNVGGSFSISKRIDLTAGVRYKSQDDIPLSSNDEREDSEAVYVGTKIRF